jgi:hypothetical protein
MTLLSWNEIAASGMACAPLAVAPSGRNVTQLAQQSRVTI